MYDEYDEGGYCEECDRCSPDWTTVAVGDLYERFVCPHCHHIHPQLAISEYGYEFQEYLLFGSNHDEHLGLVTP